jgi:hypothetical protein
MELVAHASGLLAAAPGETEIAPAEYGNALIAGCSRSCRARAGRGGAVPAVTRYCVERGTIPWRENGHQQTGESKSQAIACRLA